MEWDEKWGSRVGWPRSGGWGVSERGDDTKNITNAT